jgi:hypothetical protein
MGRSAPRRRHRAQLRSRACASTCKVPSSRSSSAKAVPTRHQVQGWSEHRATDLSAVLPGAAVAYAAGEELGSQERRAAHTAPRGRGARPPGDPAAARLGRPGGAGRLVRRLPRPVWRGLFIQPRCCAGIGSRSGAAGPAHTGVAVSPRGRRFARWCWGWRGRSRPGRPPHPRPAVPARLHDRASRVWIILQRAEVDPADTGS